MRLQRGTQYGLDGDRQRHWQEDAACQFSPDAFFAPEGHTGRWVPTAALHMCHAHCPVRADCADYAESLPTRERTSLILGGIAYDGRGKPSAWAKPARTCTQCWPERRGMPETHAHEPRSAGTGRGRILGSPKPSAASASREVA